MSSAENDLQLTWLSAADASNTKYGYRNDATAYADVLALFPNRVLAWMTFPHDATRFDFELQSG